MSCGTPVIASDTSSMVEIAPQLVEHVSPYDTKALLDAMLRYSDDKVNVRLRQKIEERYNSTDWSDTFASIRDVV